jgi:hypothetical protein
VAGAAPIKTTNSIADNEVAMNLERVFMV